VTQSS